MARPDFENVWGSTNAPFTAITDTDYKAGWVFRTGAPPRRVNFDYFQNLSDQRHQWLGEQMLLAVGHEYQPDVTYNAEAYTRSTVNGKLYKSLDAVNLGNEPSVSPSFWREVPDLSAKGVVGEIKPIARLTAPDKYLKCNGAAYSRTLYPELFSALVTDAGFTPQTFTIDIASPATVTKTAHGFFGGERVRLSTTGALPTGVNTTTDYYVERLDANTFRLLTAIVGGTRINASGTQSGTHTYLQSWFGLGDGSTTFNVPDERANVLRGLDEGRGMDSGRTLGSQQRGTIAAGDLALGGQGIISLAPFANTSLIANHYGLDLGADADWSAFASQVVINTTGTTLTTPNGTNFMLGRTRMQNGAYPFYIRYEA